MNTPNNVFVITSTINTNLGLINPEDRFRQTINTIYSIKEKDETSIIILIDNSSFPLEAHQNAFLKENVDCFMDIGQRKHSLLYNKSGIKGAGELHMILLALNIIKEKKICAKRIFKISGRYKLGKNFNILDYEKESNNFIFKNRDKDELDEWFLHTRFWSFCGTLINETIKLIRNSIQTHLSENITIEKAIYKNIDLTKLKELDTIHCEGYIAPWNILIKD
jgi:hypothetical protein